MDSLPQNPIKNLPFQLPVSHDTKGVGDRIQRETRKTGRPTLAPGSCYMLRAALPEQIECLGNLLAHRKRAVEHDHTYAKRGCFSSSTSPPERIHEIAPLLGTTGSKHKKAKTESHPATVVPSKLPGWTIYKEQPSQRDALKNSFLYYCAARERARYVKYGLEIPANLKDPRLECPVISGEAAQRFCNVHREDDRESIGILEFMRQHPSYLAYKNNGVMADNEFRHFILTLVIGRLFNSEKTMKNLGYISLENKESVYRSFKTNKERFKKHPAYQLNPIYGKAGMDMGQFIFELVPEAVKLLSPISLQPIPFSIGTLSDTLNNCLKQALPVWYLNQPNQSSIHELKPQRSKTKISAPSKRDSRTFEFKMEGDEVLRRKQNSEEAFQYAHVTSDSLNYMFNFSQAFADAAVLCPGLISLDSGMIPGPGTKSALSYLKERGKEKVNGQAELKQLHDELKDNWPECLGIFNIVTLEHSLCEWNRWLEVRQGWKKARKSYRPSNP